ncbi:Amidase 1 [Cymbomonas tetramitiformis]|uniref:Amidase 1 n=1 Tax=Cymbomonas tetramitiformis TaxID=36881 RepID=A0AAE0KSM1_9CHLO|nr:Amidase 1 [Cymbomonas tetramitiformis]
MAVEQKLLLSTLGTLNKAQEAREGVIGALQRMLQKQGSVLLLPTIPGVAPLQALPSEGTAAWFDTAEQLLALASLAGLPQVSIPVTFPGVDGATSVSLVGGHGSDAMLLDCAVHLVPRLHAAIAVNAASRLEDDIPSGPSRQEKADVSQEDEVGTAEEEQALQEWLTQKGISLEYAYPPAVDGGTASVQS